MTDNSKQAPVVAEKPVLDPVALTKDLPFAIRGLAKSVIESLNKNSELTHYEHVALNLLPLFARLSAAINWDLLKADVLKYAKDPAAQAEVTVVFTEFEKLETEAVALLPKA
jgi:hypothetical protein